MIARLLLSLTLLCATFSFAQAETVRVFAAASLKNALDGVAADWEAATGDDVVISYAGSSVLARQIGAGAPADIFISAHTLWMDQLENDGHIDPATQQDLLRNRLVLVTQAGEVPDSTDWSVARKILDDGTIATGFVDAVPAGIYAKSALLALNVWDDLSPRIAQSANVRAALALVATSAAKSGIVYETDANVEPRVQIVHRFPENLHAPIVYSAAILRDRQSPEAHAFFGHLSTEAAQDAFQDAGFIAGAGQ